MKLPGPVLRRFYSRRIMACFLTYLMLFNISLPVAWSGPEGAQVVNGEVSIQQSAYNTTITASDKAIINYSSFDIAQPETVQFIQPSTSASVLNRILSANPTNIDGTLLANGRVFFVNPAGVYIGQGAKINVNQLVASGLNISNSDFINGHHNFVGGDGAVVNKGDISAEQVYLIGKQVTNSGTISCPAGYVVMAAGDRVFLGESGSELVLEIDVSSESESADAVGSGTGVLNEGSVDAAGGMIALAAAGDIYSQAISNVGSLSTSVETGKAGQIELAAAGGEVTNDGTIEATGAEGGQIAMEGARVGQFGTVRANGTVGDGGDVRLTASDVVALSSDSLTTANAGTIGNGGEVIVYSPDTALFRNGARIETKGGSESGDGGFVEVSGKEHVEVYGAVDTRAISGEDGTLLIDPTNVTITGTDTNGSWSGGNTGTWTPSASGSVANVDTALANGNVIVTTNNSLSPEEDGDITVASGVTASANANSLTLQAADDIIVNANIDMSAGTGNLTLTADWGGGDEASDSTGAIVDGGGVVSMNATGALLMTAGSGVGTSADPIETTGLTDVAAATTSGGIFINNSTSGIVNVTTIGGTVGLDAGAGDISLLNTGRDITVSSAIDTDNGTVTLSGALLDIDATIDATGMIDLDASGNFDLDSTIASSSGNVGIDAAGTVDVATGERIIAGGDGTALTIDGAGITLNTGSAGSETVTNTGAGTITITDSGATSLANNSISIGSGTLTINSASIAGPGNNIEIYADGDISLTGAQIGGTTGIAAIGIDFAGDPSGDNTLTVNSDGDGDVGLDINKDLFDVVDISIAGVTDDTFSIDWPGSDQIDMQTNLSALTITNITTSDFGTHVVINQQAGDVIVGSVNTDAADFTLTAGNGNVTDSGAITANKLTVDTSSAALGGVITLDTASNDADTISMVSGNNSSIQYVDADGVEIELANAGAGDLTITADGDVTDSGAITANKLTVDTSGAASGGAITLDAATSDIHTINMTSGNNSNIQYVDPDGVSVELANAGAGDVTITAEGDVTDSGAITANKLTVDTSSAALGGVITLDTASNDADTITMISGNNSNIQYVDSGSIDIELVEAGNGNVTINSGGAINDAADDTVEDISATTVTMTAVGEIGGTRALETAVASIQVHSTTGDIIVNETDGITLTNVDTASGDIGVTAGGAINANSVIANDGSVSLTGNGLLTATNVQAVDSGATGDYDITLETSTGGMNLQAVSADHDITATATAGDIAMTSLTAGNAVSLEVSSGAITQGLGAIDAQGGSLTMKSDADLDMINYNVANPSGTDLTLDSTGGSVTSTAADDWQSITATANGDITLSGTSAVREITTGALTSSTGNISVRSTNNNLNVTDAVNAALGGVSLIADNGKVYTSVDTLNVPITGYSAPGTGVDLLIPGAGLGAIVIMSAEDLTLGPDATLTANGIYDPVAVGDDRSAVDFAIGTADAGDDIDVAIYLRSYWPGSSPAAGNVSVNSKVLIENNATVAVDSGERVTLGGKFYESLFNQTNRLEVVSRRSTTLNEVITYDRLPYADDPEAIRNAFAAGGGSFTGAYVLRGVRTLLAEILGLTNPVPLAPPRPLEPEVGGEVEGPDTEALISLLSELGIGVQPYVTEAYAGSLSTDLRLYSAAEKLQQLIPILEDQDGTHVNGLRTAIAQFFPSLDVLSEEQMDVFSQELARHKGDGTDYDSAARCIAALVEYVNILGTDIGWPVDKSVGFVMGRYVPRLTEGDEIRIAVIQMQLQKASGV